MYRYFNIEANAFYFLNLMLLKQTIYPTFKDKDFIEFYSTRGRHAIPPAFLARVTLLQFRENMSDPEAADACVRRLDWKIALHLALEKNTSFDPSSLCRFRKRLKENEAMSLIFDKTAEIAQEKGFIRRRTKQRIFVEVEEIQTPKQTIF